MTFPTLLNPSARMRSALFCWVGGARTLFVDGVSQGAATTLVVPAGVSGMLLSGSGGGGGGGGGYPGPAAGVVAVVRACRCAIARSSWCRVVR